MVMEQSQDGRQNLAERQMSTNPSMKVRPVLTTQTMLQSLVPAHQLQDIGSWEICQVISQPLRLLQLNLE